MDSYNPEEVFEMAREIERRGTEFYAKAAQQAADEDTRRLLAELSDMEHSHYDIFTQMKADLEAEQGSMNIVDPDNEMQYYLQEIARGHGWEGKAAPDKELTGSETMEEIFTIAIDAEKNSIQFYLGIKEAVEPKSAKKKVEDIIKEEMSHVASLNKGLFALKSQQ